MFQPFELFVGLRYTRAKRRNHFISFISMISMLGIALGVTALITVISVMNGFELELRGRILGMTSHASVSGYQSPLEDWQSVASQVASISPEVIASAPYIRGEGMLRNRDRLSGTMLHGVLPELEVRVSTVGEHMKHGALDDLRAGEFNMLMGVEIARSLGLSPGDKVDLMIPQASLTPAGILPRFRRFTLAGVFEVGMYEYDRGLVLIHMQDAAALYRMGQSVSGLRLKLTDLFQAPSVTRQLMVEMDTSFYISDWTRQHANFFRAIRTEKIVMFIILSLIVAVAAFNIVSTLVMVVTDKQADIAILRTFGVSPRSILSIFVVQGALIGVIGTLLGVVGGILLAINVEAIVPWIESLVGHDLLSAEVYYINELKAVVNVDDVIVVAFVSLLLSFISTLYPAWRAARVEPAEALRYE